MIDYAKIIILLASALIILVSFFKQRNKKLRTEYVMFLFYSFLLSIFLVFIIEVKLHHILKASLNIPRTMTYIIYFVIVGSNFFIFRRMLLQHSYILIIISFLFFGFANVTDLLTGGKIIILNNNEIVEDAFHILGTIFWLLFFINFSSKLK